MMILAIWHISIINIDRTEEETIRYQIMGGNDPYDQWAWEMQRRKSGIFYVIMYIEEMDILRGEKYMVLKFERKISKSHDNRSTVIVIPRPIAQSWEQYDLVDLVFDGKCLMITPMDGRKQPLRDERA
jgi:hypothetical protein